MEIYNTPRDRPETSPGVFTLTEW
uniref:Uncharacterized protein n=1 Tax=Arundo donax TaxID=35708 RepID=A0A0A9FYG9_ARUDO